MPSKKTAPKATAKTLAAKAKAAASRRLPPRVLKPPKLAGNDFWKRRSSHGRKPKFANADDLLDAVCQYFDDTVATPIEVPVHKSVGGVMEWVIECRPRPFTKEKMCLFIDVGLSTWDGWRNPNGEHFREDLSGVIQYAEQTCRSQAFDLAAAGLVNANIISRYLGLADKHDHSSGDGSMTPAPTVIELIGVRAVDPEEDDR